jgi:DNA-binding MarR family transcriptional regulator
MQITRQSVHELLTHMEEHGYLAREADASNGRARVVRLTATGRRLELEIRAQAGAAEAHIAALLGARRFLHLSDGLLELAQELGRAPAT